MDLVNLKTKERYLFCKQNRDGTSDYFRATLLGVFVYGVQQFTTLVCRHEEEPINRIVYHTDAQNSIVMAETLVDILNECRCNLPDDVLNFINSFW